MTHHQRARRTAWLGTALAAAALVAMAPGVGADASAQTASKPGQTATVVGTAPKTAASTLAAPTLTSVTREGDNLSVIWKASPSDGVKDYVLFADKRLAKRVTTEETDPEDRWVFNVAADGLTDTETYAIAAEDGTGNLSPLSNSMTASPPKTLTPTPQMVSAVIRGDQVTLTWTASHTDEVSGELWYWFFVDGKPYKINGVRDVTSVTLPVSDSDPVDPTGFNPGAKVTVMASDYTLINHSATSSPVVATTG